MPSAADLLRGEYGTEQRRGRAADTRAAGTRTEYERMIAGGQEELNTFTRSAVSAGMPAFNTALQGIRESAQSRGVGLGELGTSYEGDLASAFERNIANAVGQQAMNLYGTRLSAEGSLYGLDVDVAESSRNRGLALLSGQADREQAEANRRRRRRAGLFGGIGSVLGGAAGFILGAPLGAGVQGAEVGASIGGSAGAGIGG